jgi:hypothetical protein
VSGRVLGCAVRCLSSLVFWATATVCVLALRDGRLRFLYCLCLVVGSPLGCAVWRLGNALTLVCLHNGSGAGGGGDGLGVGLGSTSVTLVIGCRSPGTMEGDAASFQTWKITPSVKPGPTDWTPIQGDKGHWSILASSVTKPHDIRQPTSHRRITRITRITRTGQAPQQRIHAIERQLVAIAQTQRKSCDVKLEEEKWCEAD